MYTQGNKRKGRPPKFSESRRPVTVTLPESILARLAAINPDRAQAIVKAVGTAVPLDAKHQKQVEVVEVTPGVGIILVGPSRYLKRIKWLRLVEIAPMRYLLTIPSGTAVDSLELAVVDLLENVKSLDEWERSILEQLRDLMRSLRVGDKLYKAELLFIDTKGLSSFTSKPPESKRR
jgi:hypothetical protein